MWLILSKGKIIFFCSCLLFFILDGWRWVFCFEKWCLNICSSDKDEPDAEEAGQSMLGLQSYWDSAYADELVNFREHGHSGEVWYDTIFQIEISSWGCFKFCVLCCKRQTSEMKTPLSPRNTCLDICLSFCFGIWKLLMSHEYVAFSWLSIHIIYL